MGISRGAVALQGYLLTHGRRVDYSTPDGRFLEQNLFFLKVFLSMMGSENC